MFQTVPSTSATALPKNASALRLSKHDLKTLQTLLPSKTYQQGQLILNCDDIDRTIFFILSGKVMSYLTTPDNQEIVFAEAETGDVIGEVAALYDGRRTASVRAKDLTTLLLLEESRQSAFLEQQPHIARIIMQVMAQRLSRSSDQLRYAQLRNANAEAKRQFSPVDKFIMGAARYLGSVWSIVVLALTLSIWVYLYHAKQFDPSWVGLGLTLSVVQIVFAVAVLNSQNRTAVQEQALGDTEYHANIKAATEIHELHRRVETQHTELLRLLQELKQHNGK